MKKCKLGEIADFKTGPFGTQFKASEYTSSGYPVINVKNIGIGNIIDNDIDFISEETRARLSEHIIHEGDIVFARKGSVERHAYVRKEHDGWVQGSDCIKARITDDTDPRYISYFLHLDYVKQQLLNKAVGSTMPSMNTDILKDISIALPDKPEDGTTIANFLDKISNKIDNNQRIISTLESLSKTLYDYYFLQFDFPDEKGRPYKSSGGKMEYNAELGREIPTGWKVGKLTNYVSVIDCLHSKKPDYQYEDEKCYLIQLENLIDSGLIDLSSKYYVTKSDYDKWTSKIEVTEGDILVTNAGRVGGVYRIPSNCKAGIGRNMTALHPTKLPATYIYYYLISKDADQQIRQNTDLGTFFKSLNVKGIKLLKIIKPDEHTLKAFVNRANLTRSRIEACHNENRHLTALRDFLLPLLMNGQVGFKK